MTDTNDEITEVFDRLSHHGVKEARLEFEIKGDHSIDLDSKFHLKDDGSIEMEEKDGVLSCVMDSIVLEIAVSLDKDGTVIFDVPKQEMFFDQHDDHLPRALSFHAVKRRWVLL